MTSVPTDLRYTRDHQWLRVEGTRWTCGLTQFAANQLGDIVFVEMPEVDQACADGSPSGTAESVKAVTELYMPVAGKIAERNEQLAEEPELINTDPYGDGWIVALTPDRPADADGLMRADEYEAYIREDADE